MFKQFNHSLICPLSGSENAPALNSDHIFTKDTE